MTGEDLEAEGGAEGEGEGGAEGGAEAEGEVEGGAKGDGLAEAEEMKALMRKLAQLGLFCLEQRTGRVPTC